MGRERLELEFGPYSDWLVEACDSVGAEAIPAVARGTGNPALLEGAAAPLQAGTDSLILDVGCGLGGPSAWLARRTGCAVIGVDVMESSIRGLRHLFPELTGAVASMRALPLRGETFHGAWALGALEMVADKPGATAEIYRVLRAGSAFVIYDFVLTGALSGDAPVADRFSVPEETTACLEGAGFVLRRAEPLSELPPTPEDWTRARDAVRAEVRSRHGDDRRYRVVQEELANFRHLVRRGVIEDWLFIAEKEGT